jgi:hypothetical protein
MLLTLFAYLIWKDGRDRDLDPETEEFMEEKLINALMLIFLWPFMLIILGKDLEKDKHQRNWVIAVASAGLLSLAFGGIGLYLVLGIGIATTKGIGYLYYAYKTPIDSSEETN